MNLPEITLNQVSKQYDNGTQALVAIDLKIFAHQFMSLVGASGCGKSTILRLISGLTAPSAGTLTWQNSQLKQQLAFVFQDAALMPWATVEENIQLPLKLAKNSLSDSQEKVNNAMKLVGLESFSKSYPRQLSGGMKMRVSLARALVTEPQILLLDEPFGALDEITRSKLNDDLLQLWQEKQWTVLFVTHNIYEAVYLSNRVLVMTPRPGKIIADIKIDAPYPRHQTFRTSPVYNQYCQEVSQVLESALTQHS